MQLHTNAPTFYNLVELMLGWLKKAIPPRKRASSTTKSLDADSLKPTAANPIKLQEKKLHSSSKQNPKASNSKKTQSKKHFKFRVVKETDDTTQDTGPAPQIQRAQLPDDEDEVVENEQPQNHGSSFSDADTTPEATKERLDEVNDVELLECVIEDDDTNDFIGDFDFNDKNGDDDDFACLSPEQIIHEQNRQIKEVAEIMNVSEATAGHLLRHYRWKKEVLLTKYVDDPSSVWKETGLNPERRSLQHSPPSKTKRKQHKPQNRQHAKQKPQQSQSSRRIQQMCLICSDVFQENSCTSLSCGHCFCNDCWRAYLTTKIHEGQVVKMTCPAVKCTVFVPEDVVKKLVDPNTFDKYIRFVTKSFVENNAHVTWCPAPGCGNAITADMITGKIVRCSCGYRFCFACHREAHAPASCQQVKEWEQKCKDDSETSHWIGANTKDCPRCHVNVEKNGGCNHMTCRQCGYEWCWLCLHPWKGHNDYYTCNRFERKQKKIEKSKLKGKKNKLQKEEEEREAKRQALERYLHYFERYLNHDTASKMEKQIKEKAYKKMEMLQSAESTRAEVQFIEKGTNVLLECHNVLKYSYVYAYYLPEEGAAKELFNFLQQDLEKTIEQLNEVLEAPSTMLRKTEAVDLTKLALLKKENLIKGIENDLDTLQQQQPNGSNNTNNIQSTESNNDKTKKKKKQNIFRKISKPKSETSK